MERPSKGDLSLSGTFQISLHGLFVVFAVVQSERVSNKQCQVATVNILVTVKTEAYLLTVPEF